MIKIIIIGKRDRTGGRPVINLKGMSRMLYKFEWDKDIQSYAYEPKNQKEADDIFRTQNRLYKTMRFSVWLGDQKKKEEPCLKCEEAEKPVEKEEPCPKCEEAKKPVGKNRGRPKKKVEA